LPALSGHGLFSAGGSAMAIAVTSTVVRSHRLVLQLGTDGAAAPPNDSYQSPPGGVATANSLAALFKAAWQAQYPGNLDAYLQAPLYQLLAAAYASGADVGTALKTAACDLKLTPVSLPVAAVGSQPGLAGTMEPVASGGSYWACAAATTPPSTPLNFELDISMASSIAGK
jgi:hypothetical protein